MRFDPFRWLVSATAASGRVHWASKLRHMPHLLLGRSEGKTSTNRSPAGRPRALQGSGPLSALTERGPVPATCGMFSGAKRGELAA